MTTDNKFRIIQLVFSNYGQFKTHKSWTTPAVAPETSAGGLRRHPTQITGCGTRLSGL